MPSLQDVYDALKELGYPVAYHHFNKPPGSVPYIVYYTEGYRPSFADGLNYCNRIPLTIELYTSVKDFDAEEDVELALTELDLAYTKEEVWIEEEQIYELIYETEVFNSGQQN